MLNSPHKTKTNMTTHMFGDHLPWSVLHVWKKTTVQQQGALADYIVRKTLELFM